MTKRPLIWVFLPLFLGVFWVALGSAPAGASVIYSTNFDTLNLGNISPQDNWLYYLQNWQVSNEFYYSSSQSLESKINAPGGVYRLFNSTDDGYFDYWFKIKLLGSPAGENIVLRGLNPNGLAQTGCEISIEYNGYFTHIYLSGQPLPGLETYPNDVWYRIQQEWRSSDGKWRARIYVSGAWYAWTDWYTGVSPGYPVGAIYIGESYGSNIQTNIDDLIVGSGSLAPIYSVAITQPINATTTADFASWQVDYQFFGGNASSTNTEDLRISVDAAATSSENAVGYYSDWYSLFNIPDNSTSVRTLTIPKANVLLANHQWWAWAKLYYWNDPEPLAESAEISFYVSTSTRAWPYPGTTTPITLGFQCDAYTFPVSQMCSAAEWLIMPQQSDLAVFNSIKDEFALKAPVGYFTAAKDIIATLKSGTPTIEIAVLGGIMEPLIVGLTMLLWLVFLFWLFKRISNLDI